MESMLLIRAGSFLSLLVLLSTSNPASAQRAGADSRVRADTVQHRHRCRLAIQVLETGEPANKRTWALSIIPGCGASGGVALSSALARLRHVQAPDPNLEHIVQASVGFLDARLLQTALDIAADPTAGETARIEALRLVFHQVRPEMWTTHRDFVTDSGNEVVAIDNYPMVGTPHPADYLAGIARTLDELATNEVATSRVAALARRVKLEAETKREWDEVCQPGMSARDCLAAVRARRNERDPE